MKNLQSKITESRMTNVLYIAFVIDEGSKQKLLEKTEKYRPNWNNFNIICHHHTITFHTNMTEDIFNWAQANLNKVFNIQAIKYGISDKAFAVEVETTMPCTNDIKHITIMTNPDTNGKPVDSNYITNWKSMERIDLTGYVKIFYK